MNITLAIAAIGLGIGEPSPSVGPRLLSDPEPTKVAAPIVIRFHEDAATKEDVARAVESIRKALDSRAEPPAAVAKTAASPTPAAPGPASAPDLAEAVDRWVPFARNPAYEVFGRVHPDGVFRYTRARKVK